MARTHKLTPREGFAQRLRLARQQKYDHAYQLAQVVGLEAETYRRYERGETEPDIRALGKIARALNVSLDYLVFGDLPALQQ